MGRKHKKTNTLKATFCWGSLFLGFTSTSRLVSLLGAGAGAGARALLSSSSIGFTSGADAGALTNSALWTGGFLLLFFGKWSWDLISLGVTSTPRLASLGARSGAGTLRSAPSTGVSQALALLLGALWTGPVMSSLLSFFRWLFAPYSNISSKALLCYTLLANEFTRNRKFLKQRKITVS